MLKNNKFFIVLLVLIVSCILFVPKTYATTSVDTDSILFSSGKTVDVVGLDGKTYTMPTFPEEMKKYNNFFILKSTKGYWNFLGLLHDVDVSFSGDYLLQLNTDRQTPLRRFISC